MAKYVPIIDSNGQFSRRKTAWVRRHEEAGNGEWRDGVFLFHRQSQCAVATISVAPPAPKRAQLEDRVTRVSSWPNPAGGSGETFLPYPYQCQTSGRSMQSKYPALARQGAGL